MILLELIISDSDLGNETGNTKLTAILFRSLYISFNYDCYKL